MLPLGIRLSNPGNIEKSPRNKWQGLADRQEHPRFCTFRSPVWGLRALAVLLINYQDKHGCDTIAELIDRYAPGHENPTLTYARHVAVYAARDIHETINTHDYATLASLLRGIVTFECGPGTKHGRPIEWYPPEIYDEALRRAGVVPAPREPSAKTASDVAQATAAGTIGAAGMIELATKMLGAGSDKVQEIGAIVMIGAMIASVVAYVLHRRQRRAEVQ